MVMVMHGPAVALGTERYGVHIKCRSSEYIDVACGTPKSNDTYYTLLLYYNILFTVIALFCTSCLWSTEPGFLMYSV